MRKRRIAMLLGAAVIAFILTGCSGKAPAGSAGTQAVSENSKEADSKAQAETEGKPEAGDSAPSGETVVIKFGHNYSVDHPAEIVGQWMGGQLAEKSGGRIVLETYPSGQLGTSNELMNSVTNGTIESCVTSTFGTLEKNIYTVELPYLFSGFDHVKKFMHSEESAQLLSLLDAKGVHANGWWPVGWRNIGNNKREVKSPADLKGLLIRAFDNEILIDTLKALGANTTVMNVSEVYVALQTGALDGEENPFLNTYTMSFFEIEKYKTETHHMMNFDVVAFNQKFWDSLSAEDQKLIDEVVSEGCDMYADLVAESDDKYRDLLEEGGVQITPIEDYAPWIQAVKPVYEKWEKELDADLIQSVRDMGW